MKKLALAICASALVAIAAPAFAEDLTPAIDATTEATQTTETVKKTTSHKKHARKKAHKEANVAKQDATTDAIPANDTSTAA